ncbi:hypothetical protein ABT275_37135 [Streptomyces sp. NPDC001185]|uniref:hypothetical protein n=1 Tax=Streptomyces sp. NPDC001185 TaxID=3154380 RepID=UPI00331DEEE5
MIFWLKTRRAFTVLPVSLGVYAVLLAFVGDVAVFLPSLVGSHQVALSLFVPISIVAGLTYSLESRIAAAEVAGTRSVVRMDISFILAVVAVSGMVAFVIGQATTDPQTDATGRNVAFLTGLMLCGRVFVGDRAVLIPVAWTLSVVLTGFRPTGDPYPWTIIPEIASSPFAAAVAAVTLAIGLTAQPYKSRRIS